MKEQIKLNKEAVIAAINTATTESDAIVAVYRMVYPQWDQIAKIGDDTQSWPACNVTTWKAICRPFMDLTGRLNKARPFDKQVFCGGCWMNNGFTQDDTLRDWWVRPAPITVKQTDDQPLTEVH